MQPVFFCRVAGLCVQVTQHVCSRQIAGQPGAGNSAATGCVPFAGYRLLLLGLPALASHQHMHRSRFAGCLAMLLCVCRS
jgi:hypothetical protein